jgi:hypothetical protein
MFVLLLKRVRWQKLLIFRKYDVAQSLRLLHYTLADVCLAWKARLTTSLIFMLRGNRSRCAVRRVLSHRCLSRTCITCLRSSWLWTRRQNRDVIHQNVEGKPTKNFREATLAFKVFFVSRANFCIRLWADRFSPECFRLSSPVPQTDLLAPPGSLSFLSDLLTDWPCRWVQSK